MRGASPGFSADILLKLEILLTSLKSASFDLEGCLLLLVPEPELSDLRIRLELRACLEGLEDVSSWGVTTCLRNAEAKEK